MPLLPQPQQNSRTRMMIHQQPLPQEPLFHIINTSRIFLAAEPLIPRYSAAPIWCKKKCRSHQRNAQQTQISYFLTGEKVCKEPPGTFRMVPGPSRRPKGRKHTMLQQTTFSVSSPLETPCCACVFRREDQYPPLHRDVGNSTTN